MNKSNSRRGYRAEPGNGWLLEQALRCCRNFARNWKGDIDDADVFALFDSGNLLDERSFTALLDRHCGLHRLEKLGIVELPSGDDEVCGLKEVPHRSHRPVFRRKCLPVEFAREPSNTITRIWNV